MQNSELITIHPLGRSLSVIGRNYLHVLNKKLKHLDIDRNYYALLLIEKAEGKITQQELAGQLDIDKVTMLRSIDYLSEKGYVVRIKNLDDRRKYSLVLTKKAKKAIPEIKKSYGDINDIALHGLKPSQISQFHTLINIIKKNLTDYTANL
jgi:MarR family transcriptional regulator, transcriptional regulator for hemolysin